MDSQHCGGTIANTVHAFTATIETIALNLKTQDSSIVVHPSRLASLAYAQSPVPLPYKHVDAFFQCIAIGIAFVPSFAYDTMFYAVVAGLAFSVAVTAVTLSLLDVLS